MGGDCQSGLCADGRCGEAKLCASRFLYDALGVNIQLRTFSGKLAVPSHQLEPIKCGQCVCKDCPVSPARVSAVSLLARPHPASLCQPARILLACRCPGRSSRSASMPLSLAAQVTTVYFTATVCELPTQQLPQPRAARRPRPNFCWRGSSP